MRRTPQITVLVPTSYNWGRQLVRGIHDYASVHGSWNLWFEECGEAELQQQRPSRLGDGVIAQIATPGLARYLCGVGVPVVNISSARLRNVNLPNVSKDLTAAAQLATAHFVERGFRHFAYCAFPRSYYVENHRESFLKTLAAAGHECNVYQVRRAMLRDRQLRQEHLARWIERLPKPLGVFTWDIMAARAVIDAACSAGFDVPGKVAVLAGDDDDLTCETSRPPLSGMPFPAGRIGHEAAALLAQLMNGKRPPKEPILIEPTGIVTRQSTDVLAIDDPDLLEALRFIRERCADAIQVEDVVEAVAVSRRSLEYRFHNLLGRTIAAEIRQAHIERAKMLLVKTELPIAKVADKAGFGSPEYMSRVFKAEFGLTPLKYRVYAQGRG